MTCYILNFTLFHICGLLFLLYQPDFFLFTFVDVSGQPEAHGFPPRTCISIKCKKISGGGRGVGRSRTCFNSLPFSACASQLGYKSQTRFFWTFYLKVIFRAITWLHFPSSPAETQALEDPGLLMGTASGACRLSMTLRHPKGISVTAVHVLIQVEKWSPPNLSVSEEPHQ